MSIYKENGFENRRDYLESLCNEDFDGLITTLEDEFNY
jgi:hypothetical protein